MDYSECLPSLLSPWLKKLSTPDLQRAQDVRAACALRRSFRPPFYVDLGLGRIVAL
jgi:hypothetical protein